MFKQKGDVMDDGSLHICHKNSNKRKELPNTIINAWSYAMSIHEVVKGQTSSEGIDALAVSHATGASQDFVSYKS